VHRHNETIYREKYDAYMDKVREDKVMQVKSALCEQRSFFTNWSRNFNFFQRRLR